MLEAAQQQVGVDTEKLQARCQEPTQQQQREQQEHALQLKYRGRAAKLLSGHLHPILPCSLSTAGRGAAGTLCRVQPVF